MTLEVTLTDGTVFHIPSVEWVRRLNHSEIEVKTYGNQPQVTKRVIHAEQVRIES